MKRELHTYSLSHMPVPQSLVPERKDLQTTLLVRAASRSEALRDFTRALGQRVNKTDWDHCGQLDIPKWSLLMSTVPPGVVLYEAGPRWSEDFRELRRDA